MVIFPGSAPSLDPKSDKHMKEMIAPIEEAKKLRD